VTETEATFPPPDADQPTAAPAVPEPAVIPTRPPRAGELSAGWRVVTVVCWIGVVASFAATWNTSERLGLSTWWLGPRGEPMPVFVRLLPFVVPTLMILAVSANVRWLWRWGVAASIATAAIGFGDVGGFSGLAGVELAVAGAALAVSVASSTGTYRPVPGADDAELG
jgi:hypothetical protein